MNFPKRGEIWLSSLDPAVGREMKKTRPVIIISNNRNNEFYETITIIPLTSNVQKIYSFEAYLSRAETNLPKESKAKCDQIRTIDKKRIIKFLTAISEDKMKEVEKALLIHLGIY